MSTCIRIEKHQVNHFKELDELSFCSKNLYNQALYKVQQKFIETSREKTEGKVDHLAGESLEHHEVYLGRRVKRGLFQSSTGVRLNADLNGALGILRKIKVACEEFLKEVVASRGRVLRPVKLSC